jgi:aryl carrier-like protein
VLTSPIAAREAVVTMSEVSAGGSARRDAMAAGLRALTDAARGDHDGDQRDDIHQANVWQVKRIGQVRWSGEWSGDWSGDWSVQTGAIASALPISAHARTTAMDPEAVSGDVRIQSTSGALLGEVLGVRLERVASPRRDGVPNDWVYELQWEPAPETPDQATPALAGAHATSPAATSRERVSAARRDPQDAGDWLLIADRGGFATQLADALIASGAQCLRLHSAASGAAGDAAVGAADAADRDDLTPALRQAIAAHASGARPLRGVIHLRGLDASSLDSTSAAMLDADQAWSTASALRAMQTMATTGSPRLWLITRGAQRLASRDLHENGGRAADHPVAVTQAPLWGLGRTCAMEHPEIWGGLIDVDPQATDAAAAGQLAQLLLTSGSDRDDHEDQQLLRSGSRYVARLRRRAPSSTPATPVVVRADVSYVITGGHQGVGLEVGQWLADKGARHLAILGRSVLPSRDAWDAVDPSSRAAQLIANLRSLEARGVDVRYAAVDVGDEDAMRRWWDAHHRQAPPIAGIVHAASVWQDATGQTLVRPLLQLDATALRTVFAAKGTGSWLLDRLAASADLDFYVCFSSAASLTGSAGQGNYAAASAFLDALAHERRRRGRAGLAINWGAIGEIGFGATGEGRRIHEYWEAHGIRRLTPRDVRMALEQFLAGPDPQVAVLRTDWGRLAEGFPLLRSLPWASELVPADSAAPVDESTMRVRALKEAPPAKRRLLLIRHVRDEVARVMGLAPELVDVRRGLFEMGMDSLTALDLKNRLRSSLGIDVPAAAVFEHPTIDAIAAYLGERLWGSQAADAGAAGPRLADAGAAVPSLADTVLAATAAADTALPALAHAGEREPAGVDLLARIQQLSDEDVEQQLAQTFSARSHVQ